MMYRVKVYAVILVGGKGKRLRPLSTDLKPKAFLSITKSRKTMFRSTIDRILKVVPKDNIIVVANEKHARLVLRDFPGIRRENLLLENVSRNTAPAIAFAARTLKEKGKGAVMAVIPTDQYIIGEAAYKQAIKKAIKFISKNRDKIAVIGIRPSYPATKFGYIKKRGAKKVEAFVEKPDFGTAKKYIKDRRYLWNTGAFVFTADTILKAIKRFAPGVLENRARISIDYAVMEKAGNICCVEGKYSWRDMGSFNSLREILKREGRRFAERDGRITEIL